MVGTVQRAPAAAPAAPRSRAHCHHRLPPKRATEDRQPRASAVWARRRASQPPSAPRRPAAAQAACARCREPPPGRRAGSLHSPARRPWPRRPGARCGAAARRWARASHVSAETRGPRLRRRRCGSRGVFEWWLFVCGSGEEGKGLVVDGQRIARKLCRRSPPPCPLTSQLAHRRAARHAYRQFIAGGRQHQHAPSGRVRLGGVHVEMPRRLSRGWRRKRERECFDACGSRTPAGARPPTTAKRTPPPKPRHTPSHTNHDSAPHGHHRV